MPRVTRTTGFEAYSVRAGQRDLEWATIVIRGFQVNGNDGTPREVGEILVHSSFGSWAYQWGHLGQPFKQWLAACDDPHYVAGKFLGTKAYQFDGVKTVRELRRSVIEKRRRGDLSKAEARAIWDWIKENEIQLESSEHEFVEAMLSAKHYIDDYKPGPVGAVRIFFEEPWERACQSLSRDFAAFWRDIMPPFQEALRAELAQAKEAA